jgi:hypothetical protein
MLNKGAEEVARKRVDLSRFLIHLTRDNKAEFGKDGRSARGTFAAIWNSKKIRARKAHCLHQKRIRQQAAEFRKKFSVACFTETPLGEISKLLDIPGRQVNLEPYGFVFKKEFLLRKGAQPVQYINRYNGGEQAKAADRVFWTAVESDCKDPSWRLIPFWSAMDDGCDWSWEREWRVLGAMHFKRSDVACVILPDGDCYRNLANGHGIPVICPEWTRDEIIENMARQLHDLKTSCMTE